MAGVVTLAVYRSPPADQVDEHRPALHQPRARIDIG